MSLSFSAVESIYTLPDGLSVFTKTWSPTESPPKAQCLFLHGFSDHTLLYTPLAIHLATTYSLTFTSFDQRGFGQTSATPESRGDTGPTTQLIADLNSIILHLLNASPNLPLFLVGHSAGGALALTYSYVGSHRIRLAGIAVWSSAITLPSSAKPNILLRAIAPVAHNFNPKMKIVHKLPSHLMSRDPAVCKAFEDDEMCHDTGTLQCLRGIGERGDLIKSGIVGERWPPRLPVWVAHGTKDGVCEWQGSWGFVESLHGEVEKTWVAYEGWKHKLHAEPDGDKIKFANDLGKWIVKRTEMVVREAERPLVARL